MRVSGNPFPTDWRRGSKGLPVLISPIGYVRSIGKLTNSLRVDFNRSRTQTQNLYAFNDNIANAVGINGVSPNPFDWGLPTRSLHQFRQPSGCESAIVAEPDLHFFRRRRMESWQARVEMGRRLPAHPTQHRNQQQCARVFHFYQGLNTGFDFADFLYDGQLAGQPAFGLPQQTSVQFGEDSYHFHGNYWDLYAQDEWKVRGNLTLNVGVRYEYVSPLSEENNRITNLDLSPAVQNPALGTLRGCCSRAGTSRALQRQPARQPGAARSQQFCPANRLRVEAVFQDHRARRIRDQLQHGSVSGDRAAEVAFQPPVF